MATTAAPAAQQTSGADGVSLARVLDEGYGPGAWHGPDLKAALEDVPESLAFWRPGKDRHNIAEIALHHAYYVNSVTGRLLGADAKAFVVDGSDWFEAPNARIAWPEIVRYLAERQHELSAAVSDIEAGRSGSPLSRQEQFAQVLGITCHAVYHAGQIQLIKVLAQSR